MSFDFLSSLINGEFEEIQSASQPVISSNNQSNDQSNDQYSKPKRVKRKLATDPAHIDNRDDQFNNQSNNQSSPKRVKRKILSESQDHDHPENQPVRKSSRRAPPTIQHDPEINQTIKHSPLPDRSSRKPHRTSNFVDSQQSDNEPESPPINRSLNESFDSSSDPLHGQSNEQSDQQSSGNETESDDELLAAIAAIEAARTEATNYSHSQTNDQSDEQSKDQPLDPNTPRTRRKNVTRMRMKKKKRRPRRMEFRPITESPDQSNNEASLEPSSQSLSQPNNQSNKQSNNRKTKQTKQQSLDYNHIRYRLGYITNMGRFHRQLKLMLGVLRDVSVSQTISNQPSEPSNNQAGNQTIAQPVNHAALHTINHPFVRSIKVLDALLPVRRVAPEQIFKLLSSTINRANNQSNNQAQNQSVPPSPMSSQSIKRSNSQSNMIPLSPLSKQSISRSISPFPDRSISPGPNQPGNQSVNQSIDQLIRFYRRMRTVRPYQPNINIPLLHTRNSASVVVELSNRLFHMGATDRAFEELSSVVDKPPYHLNSLFHGLLGVYAYHLARDAMQEAQSVRQSNNQDVDDGSQFSQSFSFSLSQANNQASNQALLQKSRNHRLTALKHLQRARQLSSDQLTDQSNSDQSIHHSEQCDAWLFYETLIHVWQNETDADGDRIDYPVDHSIDGSVDPLIDALLSLHSFTCRSPHDVSGWNLKLSFLLNNHPTFTRSIAHCCLQLVKFDPCNLPALDVLVQLHREKQAISTDRLIYFLFRYLDVDPNGELADHIWTMLHELLHHRLAASINAIAHMKTESNNQSKNQSKKQYNTRRKIRSTEAEDQSFNYVTAVQASEWLGSINEPEVEDLLADYLDREGLTTNQANQQSHRRLRHGKQNDSIKKEEPQSDEESGDSSYEADDVDQASQTDQTNNQLTNQSNNQPEDQSTDPDWSLDVDMHARLEWWQLSNEYFGSLRPRPPAAGGCDFDTEMKNKHHRTCCYGLILKSVAHLMSDSEESDSSNEDSD